MPQKQLSAYTQWMTTEKHIISWCVGLSNTDCTDYTDNLSGDAEINVDAWCVGFLNTDCTDYTDKGTDTGISVLSVLSVLSVFVLNDHGIGDFYSLMRRFYWTRIARISFWYLEIRVICEIRARFLYIFRSRGESASRLGTGVPWCSQRKNDW